MIYSPGDSEYYRRASRIFHNLRYLVLLLLVLLLAVGFTAYRRELTLENFRYIMRYADFDIKTEHLSRNQISFTTPENTRFAYLKGDMALLTQKSFKSYDFTGSLVQEQKLSYTKPNLKCADKYALCYDISGTGLAIFNSYSCIYNEEFPYGIKDADIREDGSFAVATSGKYLSGKVSCYTPNFSEKFTWETRDKEVVAVTLVDNVSFVTLRVSDGDFLTYLHSFSQNSETALFEIDFVGEFPLRLVSFANGNLCLVTDKALHFVAEDGTVLASYMHNEMTPAAFFVSGDYAAMCYNKSLSSNSTVRLYNDMGQEISSADFENSIISFSAFGNDLYFLEKGKLYIRKISSGADSLEYKNVSEMEVDPAYSAVFAKSGTEYVLASPTGAGKFK